MAQQLQIVLDGETETLDLAELNITALDPQQDRREVVELVADRLQIEVTRLQAHVITPVEGGFTLAEAAQYG